MRRTHRNSKQRTSEHDAAGVGVAERLVVLVDHPAPDVDAVGRHVALFADHLELVLRSAVSHCPANAAICTFLAMKFFSSVVLPTLPFPTNINLMCDEIK